MASDLSVPFLWMVQAVVRGTTAPDVGARAFATSSVSSVG